LDWWLTDFEEHKAVQRCVQALNHTYRNSPALWERDHEPGGFEWLVSDDADSNTFAWLRWGQDGKVMACITNFSPVPRVSYKIPLPLVGDWKEVLNTDAVEFGGSGQGNLGVVHAKAEPHFARPASAEMLVPPLASVWLEFQG
jgi:1,4-alpha-glucan branching enzyme